jgi:hypothetical protein
MESGAVDIDHGTGSAHHEVGNADRLAADIRADRYLLVDEDDGMQCRGSPCRVS